MSMFTDEQKRRAWDRLRSGRSAAGDVYLAHTMMAAAGNIRMFRSHFPDQVYRLEVVYRLVRRGVIVTKADFDAAYRSLTAKRPS